MPSAAAVQERLRTLGGALSLWQLGKMTLASTVSYGLALVFARDTLPVLAPIAALLVVQGSVYATARQSLQVLAGVVVGSGVGLAVVATLGAHWWTIALVTALGLALRELKWLGKGPGMQVPITALLVLTLGSHYGAGRILDTFLGAAVGLVINVAVVPPVGTPAVRRTMRRLARSLGTLLGDVVAGLGEDWDRDKARGWLDRARSLEEDLGEVRDAIASAEESARWNPRPHAREPLPGLREAARTLDNAAGQIRAVTRGLVDLASAEGHEGRPVVEVPTQYRHLLEALGAGLTSYGDVVAGENGAVEGLRRAVDRARAHRDRVSSALSPRTTDDDRTARLLGTLVAEPFRLLSGLSAAQDRATGGS